MTTDSQIISHEGYFIIFLSFLLTTVSFFICPFLGALTLLWLFFCVYFFRNPKRQTPDSPDALIVPADGKVIHIGKAQEKHFLNKEMQRVTIFMSPFDVHVNRSPASGVVKNTVWHHGKFLAAFGKQASEENERSAIHMEVDGGEEIVFVQIAGWFARRIVSYPKNQDKLQKGSIFGVIKFGSRMDIYFSDSYKIDVELNQKVKAGETILGHL